MQTKRITAAMLATVLSAGCFVHRPVTGEPAALRRGEVRVLLSEPGTFDLGDLTAQQVVRLDGEMIGWRGDSLSLSATQLRAYTGTEFPGQGRTVTIARDRIQALQVKRMDPWRSLLLGAGILAAIFFTGPELTGGTDEGPGTVPGGGNPK